MVKSRRTRIRRSAQDWRKILARLEQGGQSQREFCQREGLALSTFPWWRRKRGRVQRDGEGDDAAWFVELSDESAGRQEVDSSPRGWEVELELGEGMVVLPGRDAGRQVPLSLTVAPATSALGGLRHPGQPAQPDELGGPRD